jgi:hypothetical protein
MCLTFDIVCLIQKKYFSLDFDREVNNKRGHYVVVE